MLARTEVRLLLGVMGAVGLFTIYRSRTEHRAHSEPHNGLMGGPTLVFPPPPSSITDSGPKTSTLPRNSSPLAPPVPARPAKDKIDSVSSRSSSSTPTATLSKKTKASLSSSTPPLVSDDSLNITPSEAVVRDAQRLSSFVASEREALVTRNGSLSVSEVWEVLDEVANATHDHADEVKAQLERHIAKAEEDAKKKKSETTSNSITSTPEFDLNVFLPATLETSAPFSKRVSHKME